MENETIQILELFGGIGSPRCALRNLNIPTKAIDYVEINEKAVRSYNSMFREELAYKTQTVVGWNLKPDILIHGSPCQDMSIAGHQGKATGEGRINRGKGSDEGSGTRSSLMWETIHIIENMGEWRPRYVIWENVKNVKSKYMRPNFDRYMVEMERLGYTNNFEVLDAREFGLPQARKRVFTVSVLNGERFEFDDLIRTPMRNLQEFLEDDASVPDVYDVTQPSVLACIGEKGIRRATVIKDCAYTITTRQDRTPAQVIDRGDGRYRYLTERECWRLITLNDNAHVAVNLTDGAKSSGTGASNTTTVKSNAKVDVAHGFNKSFAGTYKVTASGLNLRAGAGTGKSILAVMKNGEKVQCYGYYNDCNGVKWLYVVYKNIVGYVSSKYLSK